MRPALGAYQRARCLAAMDDIQKLHIARAFGQPVDPVRDNCPTYETVVSRPMDLGTARRKLEDGEYATVEEWKSGLDLVWTNAMAFNGAKSTMTMIAKQLQASFNKISAAISSDPEADWGARYERLKADVNAVIMAAPNVLPLWNGQRRPPMTRSMSTAPPGDWVEKGGSGSLAPQEMTAADVRRIAEDVNLIEDTEVIARADSERDREERRRV